jgi:hypothetical protein
VQVGDGLASVITEYVGLRYSCGPSARFAAAWAVVAAAGKRKKSVMGSA